jgi:hypothetical protein
MLKLLTFPGVDEDGNILVQAFHPGGDGLTKLASGELHPEVAAYANNLKPEPGKLYILVNALGAGEYYGANINGDYFEEKQLNPSQEDLVGGDLYGYRTYETAGIYRHHQNKDQDKSMGMVGLAVYNKTMRRVEIILVIDRDKARDLGHQKLIDELDAGGHPAVSMGCRVKYDVCSICGNKSKTRNDYCIHTKNMMNQVLPDGRKVFVYNPRPKFFDISFVLIPADRTGYTMLKVASIYNATPSADLAVMYNLRDKSLTQAMHIKVAEKQKLSKMIKRLPALSSGVLPHLTNKEPSLPAKIIRMMIKMPWKKSLTSTAASGMVMKPSEFQRVLLHKMGKPKLAEALNSQGLIFSPVTRVDRSMDFGLRSELDKGLVRELLPLMSERSSFSPLLARRVHFTKTATVGAINSGPKYAAPDPYLDVVSAAYNGYREQLLEKISSIVVNITSHDIELVSEIDEFGFEDAFVGEQTKTASKKAIALLGAIPLAYLYGAHVSGKRGRSEIGNIKGFMDKHPVLAASVFVGLTRLGTNLHKRGLLNKGLLTKLKV